MTWLDVLGVVLGGWLVLSIGLALLFGHAMSALAVGNPEAASAPRHERRAA